MAKQLNVSMNVTANVAQAKAQMKDLQNSLRELSSINPTGIDKMNKDLLQGKQAAIQLSTALEMATNQNTGRLDLTKFNSTLKKSGIELKQYASMLQAMGPQGSQAFMKVATAISQAEIPTIRLNALFERLWTTMKNTARWQLSSAALHAAYSGLYQMVGYAKDLDKSLNNIRIVTGQSAEEMAHFAKQANKAAQRLSVTTTDYTNAALIYYQQGLTGEEVEKRAEVTAKMANVTRQSAETVSSQLTAIWNNFYDGSKSLEYYADVLTALGAATASSTDEISQGLEKFAAIADTVGLSYEYAATALATVTAETRQSADVVGTAFKTLFARIQDLELGKTLDDGVTLGKYSEALDKIGVKVLDANGNLRAMNDILDDMGSRWDKVDKATQVAVAQAVGGTRQYAQLIALMDNWDQFQTNLMTAEGAEGTLQEQADIYAQSWEGATKRVKAAAEALYSDIIDDKLIIELMDFFGKVLKFIDKIIDSMGGMPGLLSLIGSLVFKIAGPQIAEGFRNIGESVKSLITHQKEARDLQNDVFNMAAKTGAFNQNTAYGKAQLELYKEIAKYQEYITKNEATFTEFEARAAQQGMTILQQSTEGVLNTIKENELLSQRLKQEASSLDIKISELEVKQQQLEAEALASEEQEYQKKVAEEREKIEKNIIDLKKQYAQQEAAQATARKNVADAEKSKIKAQGKQSDISSSLDNNARKLSGRIYSSGVTGEKAVQTQQKLEKAMDALAQKESKINEKMKSDIENIGEHFKKVFGKAAESYGEITAENATQARDAIMSAQVGQLSSTYLGGDIKTNNDLIVQGIKLRQDQVQVDKEVDKATRNVAKAEKECREIVQQSGIEKGKLTKKIKEQENARDGEIQILRKSKKEILEENKAVQTNSKALQTAKKRKKELVQQMRELINSSKKTKQGIKDLSAELQHLKGPKKDWAAGLTNFASKAMNFSFALSSAKSLVETLKDPDMSAMDKLTSSLMSISFIVPSLVPVLKGIQGLVTLISVSAARSKLFAEASMTVEQQKFVLKRLENGADEKTIANWMIKKGFAKDEAGAQAIINALKEQGAVITLKELGLKIKKKALDVLEIIHLGIKIALQTVLNALTGNYGALIQAAAIALGVALVAIIGIVSNQAALNKEVEEANKQLEMSEERYRKAKEEAEELRKTVNSIKQAWEDFNDAQKSLKGLTKGTTEWKEALLKSNEAVMALIDEMPELASAVENVNGQLIIDPEAYNKALDKKIEELNQKQADAYRAQTQVLEDKNNLAIAEAKRLNNKHEGSRIKIAEGQMDKLIQAFQEGDAKTQTELYNWLTQNGNEDLIHLVDQIYQKLGEITDTSQRRGEEALIRYGLTGSSNSIAYQAALNSVSAKRYGGKSYDDILHEEWANVVTKYDALKGHGNVFTALGPLGQIFAGISSAATGKHVAGDSTKEVGVVYTTGNYADRQDTALEDWARDHGYSKEDYEIRRNESEHYLVQKGGDGKRIIDYSHALKDMATAATEERIGKYVDGLVKEVDQKVKNIQDKFKSIDITEEQANKLVAQEYTNEDGKIDDYSIFSRKQLNQAREQDLIEESNYISAMAEKRNQTYKKDIEYYENFAEKQAEELQKILEDSEMDQDSFDAYVDMLLMTEEALDGDRAAAERYAKANLKLSNSIDSLNTILEDGEDALEAGGAAAANVYSQLEKALKEWLDVDFDTDEIITYMDDIREAAAGSEEAIKRLSQVAAQKILDDWDIEINNDKLQNAFQTLKDFVNNEFLDTNVEVGVTMDEAGFTEYKDALNELLYNAQITAEDATKLLNTIGWTPDLTFVEGEWAKVGEDAYLNSETGFGADKAEANKWEHWSRPMIPQIGEGTRAKSWKPSPTPKSIKKSSGGSGGDKSKKEVKKLDDELDRYHYIKEILDDISNELDKVGKAKDRAFGAAKLKNMDKEIALFKKQIAAQKQYLKEINDYYKKDREALAEYGAIFDEEGRVSNYEALMQAYVDQYNEGVKKFNSGALEEEQFKAYEENYQAFKKALEQYEETNNLAQEQNAKLQDMLNELADLRLEKLKYNVEVRIELNDDDLKLLDHLLNEIEDDAFAAAEKIDLLGDKAQSNINKVNVLQQGIRALLEDKGMGSGDINAILGGDMSSVEKYRDLFTEADIETLRDYTGQLMSLSEELQDIRKQVAEEVINTFDAWVEKVDKTAEAFERLTGILDHYKNIIGLVGKARLGISNDIIKDLNNTAIKNSINQLDSSRQYYESLQNQQAEAQKHLDEARKRGIKADIKMWEDTVEHINDKVNEVQENMLSNWEATLQKINEIFKENVEMALEDAKKAANGYATFDIMKDQYEKTKEQRKQYLDDYEKMVRLNELNRQISKDIDNTDNIKSQEALRDLQNEINNLQASGIKMSQYDLDYLKKRYELKKAELAIEEAQNTMSTVRLRRDDEGNWGYVYTADQSKIDDAKTAYEQKILEMRDLSNSYIEEMSEKIIEAREKCAQEIAAIDQTVFDSQESYMAEVNRITDYYQGQIDYYLGEIDKGLDNNNQLFDLSAEYYNSNYIKPMLDGNAGFQKDFQDTVLHTVSGGIDSTIEYGDQMRIAFETLLGDLNTNYNTMATQTDLAMQAAGTSVSGFSDQVAGKIEEVGTETDKTKDAVDNLAKAMEKDTIRIMKAAADWQDKWSPKIENIKKAINSLTSAVNTLIQTIANLNKTKIEPKVSKSTDTGITSKTGKTGKIKTPGGRGGQYTDTGTGSYGTGNHGTGTSSTSNNKVPIGNEYKRKDLKNHIKITYYKDGSQDQQSESHNWKMIHQKFLGYYNDVGTIDDDDPNSAEYNAVMQGPYISTGSGSMYDFYYICDKCYENKIITAKDSVNNPTKTRSLADSYWDDPIFREWLDLHAVRGGCFEKGTEILMADNTFKFIEDVKVDDMVMAYNEVTGDYNPKPVLHSFIHHNTVEMVDIYLSNGIRIGMTACHPILTTDGWKSLNYNIALKEHEIETSELKIGQEVIGLINAVVEKIEWRKDIPNYDTYNITVEDDHTYIANGYVVHNMPLKASTTKMQYDTGGYTGTWAGRRIISDAHSPITGATGMYTGEWGNSGRLAVLHQKELVLNAKDTENFLDGIGVLRQITNQIDLGVMNSKFQRLQDFMHPRAELTPIRDKLDQNVQITAEFPNAVYHDEIEQAFNNLIGLASQYAGRDNK